MDDEIIVEEIEKPAVVDSTPLNTQLVGHLVLAEHFNIDLPTDEDSNKLKTIWNYVSVIDPTADPEGILLNLERRLGAPRLGESLLDKVYRWVKLKEQSNIIQEKINRVESSGDLHQRQEVYDSAGEVGPRTGDSGKDKIRSHKGD